MTRIAKILTRILCEVSAGRLICIGFLSGAFVLPLFGSYTLDPTFGSNGKVTISFPDSTSNYTSQARRLFLQPTGRVLIGGNFTNATSDGQLTGVALVGLTPVGDLDPGFGSGGIMIDWRSDAITSFSDALMYPGGATLRISQVLRLPAGSSTVRTVRLTADGVDDNVFASNVSIGPCCVGFFSARPVQIAVRSDGKILALITNEGEYNLYRLNADGTRDSTFGSNGIVPITFNRISPLSAVQMIATDDGKILLVGNVGSPSPDHENYFLARLTETGSWDKTFGRVGFSIVPFGAGVTGRIRDATLQTDGKIVLAGSVANSDTNVWIARYKMSGRLDTTFGDRGVVIKDLASGSSDIARSVVHSPDGKIRIAGEVGPSGSTSFLVARFSSNGAFEEQITFSFVTGQYSGADDLVLQPDGKVLVAGYSRNPSPSINGNVFAAARLIE